MFPTKAYSWILRLFYFKVLPKSSSITRACLLFVQFRFPFRFDEQVCIEAVEAGEMTKDLSLLVGGSSAPWQTTEEFLETLDRRLQKTMA